MITLATAGRALRQHWPEYLIEACALGAFMVSAAGFGVLLEGQGSPLRDAIANPLARRALMGLAMGLTAMAIIYSPFGKRSGAHMNPALTLTFLRLRKIEPADAAFYIAAQFAGGLGGLLLAGLVLGPAIAQPSVRWVATTPGASGLGVAFAAEVGITFVLMMTVLTVSNRPRIARFTGVCAGTLVALYITLEAPLSGMSMNPARTFASATPSGLWHGAWIYFTAPVLGMALAAECYVHASRRHAVLCAKLHHDNDQRCIFRCNWCAHQA